MRVLTISATAVAALLAAGQAGAQVSATVGGDYANTGFERGVGHGDGFDVNGKVDLPLDWNGLGVEAAGGYSERSGSALFGQTANVWNVGGSVYWTDPNFLRLVASYNYLSDNALGSTVNVSNYGAGAEFYPLDILTFAAKGGGFSGNFRLSGWYLGGNATGYILPDLALSGSVDDTDETEGSPFTTSPALGSDVDLTFKAEWLVSEEIPFAVYGGYTYSAIDRNWGLGPNANTFFVGAKFYLNSNGAQTLEARQRDTGLDWTTHFAAVVTRF